MNDLLGTVSALAVLVLPLLLAWWLLRRPERGRRRHDARADREKMPR
jgi:hypothetical protein